MIDEDVFETLALRERYRDWYRQHRDPVVEDRMLWRAQAFRHLVHLLPGQTVLELGCGQGAFTRRLAQAARSESPITAVTFDPHVTRPAGLPDAVTFARASSLPGPLEGRRFDYIVAMDLLDRRNCSAVLRQAYELLSPGGEVLLYQSNPWNVVLKMRRALSRLSGQGRDPRLLLSRPQLYELLSEIGFVRIFSRYNDFVYAPLTPRLIWFLRNLSVVLENTPGIQTLAGSILVHAQKPPRPRTRPGVSLFAHESLRRAVSVVIPCLNEEMNVAPLVRRLDALYGEYIHEIILVDDHSTDGTRRAMRQLAAEDARVRPVFRSPPRGVGRALADGYRAATGEYILSMDCDFQHLLPEMRDLFDAAAQGHEVVVGSRFSRHSVLLNYPFQKIVANRSFHLLAQLLLQRQFRDVTNNLKLFRREIVEQLPLTEPGFACNAETGLLPLLMNCRFAEVPISWINRAPDMGTSSFRLARVGNGYGRVLYRLWLKRAFDAGPYQSLAARAPAPEQPNEARHGED